ncbi:hypothetical protein HDU86_000572 [Geranomyces michiganensis]|nr:hypothetical protein HDU86_000572 [Geranomyces michiganensis]
MNGGVESPDDEYGDPWDQDDDVPTEPTNTSIYNDSMSEASSFVNLISNMTLDQADDNVKVDDHVSVTIKAYATYFEKDSQGFDAAHWRMFRYLVESSYMGATMYRRIPKLKGYHPLKCRESELISALFLSNPKTAIEVINTKITSLINLGLHNNHNIAKIVRTIHQDNLVYLPDSQSIVMYDEPKGRWVQLSKTEFKGYITTAVPRLIVNYSGIVPSPSTRSKLIALAQILNGNSPTKRGYITSLVEDMFNLFCDYPELKQDLDAPNVFHMSDCVYDSDARVIREHRPTDMCFRSTNHPFDVSVLRGVSDGIRYDTPSFDSYPIDSNHGPYDWDLIDCLALLKDDIKDEVFHKTVDDVIYFIKSVFPLQDLRNYWLITHAAMLNRTNKEKLVFVYDGKGDNAKTVIFNIIKRMLGGYSIQTVPKFLTGSSPDAASGNALYAKMDKVGVALVSETSETAPIQLPLVKYISGNEDGLENRTLYEKKTSEIRLNLLLIIATNHPLTLTGMEEAVINRFRVIPFLSKFTSAVDEYTPPADPNLKGSVYLYPRKAEFGTKIFESKAATLLMKLLVKIHQSRKLFDVKPLPEIVKSRTDEFTMYGDVVSSYFMECLERTDDPNDTLSTMAIYQNFELWYKEKYKGAKMLNQPLVMSRLSRLDTIQSDRDTFIKIKFKDRYADDDFTYKNSESHYEASKIFYPMENTVPETYSHGNLFTDESTGL